MEEGYLLAALDERRQRRPAWLPRLPQFHEHAAEQALGVILQVYTLAKAVGSNAR
jgi:hypothetical protein